jgi:hypothetical protein
MAIRPIPSWFLTRELLQGTRFIIAISARPAKPESGQL